MNERILELAKQAGLKFPSETALSPQELKFAELIIRKCLRVVYDRSEAYDIKSKYMNYICQEAKEHFGVEQ